MKRTQKGTLEESRKLAIAISSRYIINDKKDTGQSGLGYNLIYAHVWNALGRWSYFISCQPHSNFLQGQTRYKLYPQENGNGSGGWDRYRSASYNAVGRTHDIPNAYHLFHMKAVWDEYMYAHMNETFFMILTRFKVHNLLFHFILFVPFISYALILW